MDVIRDPLERHAKRQFFTVWKMSKYGVFSGPNKWKYGLEKTSHLDTFLVHAFFFISSAFLNSASVFLNFFMTWASNMLHRRSLVHISIIIIRYFLYLLYLCPCLDIGVLMSYLCYFFSFASSFLSWLIE